MKQILRKLRVILILPLIYVGLHLAFRPRSKNVAPSVIAHRGAAGLAPENTQAAIRAGIQHKADFIEVDIQRSADDVLIVIHDQTVDRTTDGHGAVVDLTWAEISQFEAGSYFGPEYAGETVPRLDAVLEMTKGTSSTWFIEIKEPHLYPGIEQQIAETIQNAQAQDQVTIISFDYESLRKFSELMPNVPLGFISKYPITLPKIAKHQSVDVLWLSVILDPTLVRRLHNQGYQVWVWTIDNWLIIRLLIWLGVDGITTNRPDLFNTIPGATG